MQEQHSDNCFLLTPYSINFTACLMEATKLFQRNEIKKGAKEQKNLKLKTYLKEKGKKDMLAKYRVKQNCFFNLRNFREGEIILVEEEMGNKMKSLLELQEILRHNGKKRHKQKGDKQAVRNRNLQERKEL